SGAVSASISDRRTRSPSDHASRNRSAFSGDSRENGRPPCVGRAACSSMASIFAKRGSARGSNEVTSASKRVTVPSSAPANRLPGGSTARANASDVRRADSGSAKANTSHQSAEVAAHRKPEDRAAPHAAILRDDFPRQRGPAAQVPARGGDLDALEAIRLAIVAGEIERVANAALRERRQRQRAARLGVLGQAIDADVAV